MRAEAAVAKNKSSGFKYFSSFWGVGIGFFLLTVVAVMVAPTQVLAVGMIVLLPAVLAIEAIFINKKKTFINKTGIFFKKKSGGGWRGNSWS